MCARSADGGRAGRDGRDGLSQQRRGLAALDPATAPLDQRGPAMLAARARGYAPLLNFFGADGAVEGDWQPFWRESDPTFLLAEIAVTPQRAGAPASERPWRQVHAVLAGLWAWYDEASLAEASHLDLPTSPLLLTLRSVIPKLLAPPLLLCLATSSPPDADTVDGVQALIRQSGWAALWAPSTTAVAAPAPPSPAQLALLFRMARQRLETQAQQQLERILAPDEDAAGRHPPHTALYLSFLRLFGVLQGDVNRFTGRHLDYYYQTVLGLAALPGDADRAALVFALGPAAPTLLLKAGTQVSAAPKPGAAPLRYAVERDTQLSHAAVVALASVYVDRPGSDVHGVYAAPVADSADGLGALPPPPGLGWPPFGMAWPQASAAGTQARLGLLLASPVLMLSEGERLITLHFTLAKLPERLDLSQLPSQWLPYVSGADGWRAVSPACWSVDAATATVQLALRLAPGAPALAANGKLTPPGGADLPMLKLVLDPAAAAYGYTPLSEWAVQALAIEVQVNGLAGLKIDTDAGPVAVGKPFAPFGAAPLPRAGLRLAHPELSAKRADSLTVHVQWHNLPLPQAANGAAVNLQTYYAGYLPYTFDDAAFLMEAEIAAGGAWHTVCERFPMFALTAQQQPLPASTWSLPTLDLHPGAAPVAAPKVADGTLQLTFAAPSYGFGQALYPALFTEQAWQRAQQMEQQMQQGVWARILAWLLAALARLASGLACLKAWLRWLALLPATGVRWLLWRLLALFMTPPFPQPAMPPKPQCAPAPPPQPAPPPPALNAPFVPMIKALTLDYHARVEAPQGFYLHPFGVAPIPAPSATAPVAPLPAMVGDGQLCIGLRGLRPGLPLSLHLELRARSGGALRLAQGDAAAAAGAGVTWCYLRGQRWCAFPSGAVASDTDNLDGSGIVTLRIPDDIDAGDALMSAIGKDDVSWISVSVAGGPERYPTVIGLHLHAAMASRAPGGERAATLPAATLGRLVQPQAAIKSVSQPYASFGGRAAESLAQFRVRVSERLRHKQRASQMRDYEQLVLQAFPEVWQVKCLGPNATRGLLPASLRLASGGVALVVAPPPGARPDLAPPFSQAMLGKIGALAQACCAPSVTTIWVRNVRYEYVQLACRVRLDDGVDVQQTVVALNAAINAALSPWLARDQPPLQLGTGAARPAELAELIRLQPGVRRVEPGLGLRHWAQEDGAGPPMTPFGAGDVAPSTPWSVLVPYPAHMIDVLPATPGDAHG